MLSKYILWFLNQVSWICPQIRDMLLQSQTIRFLRLKPYRQWQIQVEVGGDGVAKGGWGGEGWGSLTIRPGTLFYILSDTKLLVI